MINENKIVTLENNEKYLILNKEIIDKKEFIIGIKIENEKYTNEFKFFIESKKNEEVLLEEIQDEELIKVIVNSYILNNI